MKLGFIVNPISGMGGSVGLKGTDDNLGKALSLGAKPVSAARAADFLRGLGGGFTFLTCSGSMGSDMLEGFDFEIVYEVGEETSAQDTVAAARVLLESGVELIIFCGGDGTARNLFEVVGTHVPVLGVPAGVKMHSSCFAINPQAAAEVCIRYSQGVAKIGDCEIMDVDEERYRNGILQTRLYGVMRTPYVPELVQHSKGLFQSSDDMREKQDIARFAREFMSDGSVYIIGAGTTTKAIAEELGFEKTLLGVDVVGDGVLLASDANESRLLSILDEHESVKIIVSPIGGQGFVFGRGSQQISPKVIRSVGVKNIIYVATTHKLNSVPHLLVDTQDVEVDGMLCGYRSVVIGYRIAQKKHVKAFRR